MFDPVCSDPPLLLSPIHLLIEQSLGGICTCSVWCFFFFLGECM
ncbi:unnamed protein product [Staurois parvus]|uniref:Uncharacterized protein n=1 Tax=Staurois parvus TaxID=386267 RepID=A0ABN9AVQ3_9NEOB|nr:unnamed protein product [Staurois parvus]